MAKKQKLGPRQRRWLRMLETTRRKQAKGQLYDGRGYCCLGIGVLAAGRHFCEDSAPPGVVSGLLSLLPKNIARHFKLRTEGGTPKSGGVTGSLYYLNDTDGKTFREIAAVIRANPEQYFTGPA